MSRAGVHYVCPGARTVIDIGGQDAKVLSLNEEGRTINFVMNDKRAAGAGRDSWMLVAKIS
ncbi:MAG: BadF/BadG/BcrA/BcrD ATPase family protein [Clostridium sp.]